MIHKGWSFLLAGVVLTAAGCTVGPNFKKPKADVPGQWSGQSQAAPMPSEAEQALTKWWDGFNDPKLTNLIERAFESNLDMKIAASRIRQSRASRGMAFAKIGPTVDAGGSFTRGQTSGSPKKTSVDPVTKEKIVTGGKGKTSNQYQAGFDASWELDIVGGTRREIEAAEAEITMAEESRRDVWVTLAGEVASNYIELRANQEQIEIAKRNLKTQEYTAELTRRRFEGGFVSGLDVANSQAQMSTTKAQIPLLEQGAQEAIYRLSVLLGNEPGALIGELSEASQIPEGPAVAEAGVPSELLRRRPDVRQAEAAIHAATARIGAAESDFFPKFNLISSYGYRAAHSGDLFDDPVSRFWSLGPGVSWRIFDTGAILSNIELQKAMQEESMLVYRQTVLQALQDVENSLFASTKEREHYAALGDAVNANHRAVELATKLYADGLTDFLNVLESQRSQFATEVALSQSRRDLSLNQVALYKALGGGWGEILPDAEQ